MMDDGKSSVSGNASLTILGIESISLMAVVSSASVSFGATSSSASRTNSWNSRKEHVETFCSSIFPFRVSGASRSGDDDAHPSHHHRDLE